MKTKIQLIICICTLIGCAGCYNSMNIPLDMCSDFVNPPNKYRPQPFWHINGELTTDSIEKQLSDVTNLEGFGGVSVLPLTPAKMWTSEEICPGTTPEYLSESYFDRYRDILKCSEKLGMEVILYDDLDFPSGVLGGKIRNDYPQYTQKRLSKEEWDVTGSQSIRQQVPIKDLYMGTMAMNLETLERIDLTNQVSDGVLDWTVPTGKWKIMSFYLEYNVNPHLDYMDDDAINLFISKSYDQYAREIGDYFGKTIRYTFFDDVGYLGTPCYWNVALSELFEKRYGKKAILYYPALWYNIGSETEATRIAFYGLRAEMIGEGYVRKVAEWSTSRNLLSMGHPPGSYEPTSVDMYGDPFKFYKHMPVPLMDAIHGYPYGRPGLKLVSSAAELHGHPNVAIEIYGNYPADMDSLMLYRVAMEVMLRGANFFIPHGIWYDPTFVKIPPLISHYNELFGSALSRYSNYIGRSVSLLQDGNRVADIALLYPIESLEGWYEQGHPERPTIGKDVPPGTDYNRIGDMLTGQIRKDFTFIHPEEFVTDKYQIENDKLRLLNSVTHQEYKLLIIPSSQVLSVETMKKVKAFYLAGGKILATHQLPYKSAEFGRDGELQKIVKEIFGIDPQSPMPNGQISMTNAQGGQTIFLPSAEKDILAETIDLLLPCPDVRIEPVELLNQPDALHRPLLGVDEYRSLPSEKLGMLSYIHKQKEGLDIYMFANSTDHPVETKIELKGKLALEVWNPHTGSMGKMKDIRYEKRDAGSIYTIFTLDLPSVNSLFLIGKINK